MQLIVVQDAHEFLNYLLNECSELLEKEAKERDPKGQISKFLNGMRHSQPQHSPPTSTWITEIFQVRGIYASLLQPVVRI